MENRYICVDFDGTVVTHEYPNMGRFIGAPAVLRKLADYGFRLILFTMRDGKTLDDAVEWFRVNDIPLYGINENPDQDWSASRKVYANFYIDDAAVGAPLVKGLMGERPYIDWELIKLYFPMIKWND